MIHEYLGRKAKDQECKYSEEFSKWLLKLYGPNNLPHVGHVQGQDTTSNGVEM